MSVGKDSCGWLAAGTACLAEDGVRLHTRREEEGDRQGGEEAPRAAIAAAGTYRSASLCAQGDACFNRAALFVRH